MKTEGIDGVEALDIDRLVIDHLDAVRINA